MPTSTSPSASPSWLSAHPAAWIGILGVPAAAFVVGYIFEYVPETLAALVMSAVVVLGTGGFVVRSLLAATQGPRLNAAVAIAGLGLIGLSAAPAYLAVSPGQPVAAGDLAQVGDNLPLAAEVHGPVRVWFHGAIGRAGSSKVTFELEGPSPALKGSLERNTRSVRVGRRGHAEVTDDHNSDVLSAFLPEGTTKLSLASLEGPLGGPLQLKVFHDYWPLTPELVLAGLVLLAIGLLSIWSSVSSSVTPLAGFVLAYGMLTRAFATPDVAVRAQIGAVIVGGIAGMSVGGVVSWVSKKALGPALARAGKAPKPRK